MVHIVKRYVTANNVQIHVRLTSPPATRVPLVCLHQTASSSAMFERLMACLGQDVWLIAPDTPGFGASDALPEPPTVAAWASGVLAVLDELGIGRFDIFGHHTGAAIAVELAVALPERVRNVILCGPPLVDEATKTVLRQKIRPIPIAADGTHLQATWQRINAKDASLPDWLVQRETLLTAHAGEQAAAAYEAVFAYDFAGKLRHVQQPTLVFAGMDDSLRHAVAPTAVQLPHGRAVIVDGAGTFAGTFICDQQPELVAALIRPIICDQHFVISSHNL